MNSDNDRPGKDNLLLSQLKSRDTRFFHEMLLSLDKYSRPQNMFEHNFGFFWTRAIFGGNDYHETQFTNFWRIIFVVGQKGKIETVWRAGAKEASLTFLIYINLWSLRVCSLPGGGGAKYHLKNFCF